MENRECLDTDRNLQMLYFRTFHTIETAFKKRLRRNNIPPQIAIILVAIFQLNSPSPMELSRSCGRTPQTITAIINRMEKRNLVKRVRCSEKKNKYRIYLTREGLLAYQKIQEIDIFSQIIQALSEEKCKQFLGCLHDMAVQIDKLKL